MKICVINEDKTVMIDNETLSFDFSIDSKIWAIHFDSEQNVGSIEYADATKNEEIDSFDDYMFLVDLFNEKKIELEQEEAILEQTRINSPDYVRNQAWLNQTYEVRAGLIITVRPAQVGKSDDAVLRGFLFNFENEISTEELVTDIEGNQQAINKTETLAAIADGIRQTKENYNIYYAAVNQESV